MGWLDGWRAGGLLDRGQAQLAAGKTAAAAETLAEAARLAPADHGVHLHLALARGELGQHEAALEGLEAARGRFRDPAIYGLFRGILLLDAGRATEAQTALAEASGQAPDNRLIAAYRELARIQSGAREEGILALRRSGLPENFAFQRRLAIALERWLFLDREPDEPPLEATAADQPPAHPPVVSPEQPPVGVWQALVGDLWYRRRADRFAAANDFERALPAYEEAYRRAPDDLDLLAYLAEARFHTKRYREAREALLYRREQVAALAAEPAGMALLARVLRLVFRIMTLGLLFREEEQATGDIYEVPALGYIGSSYYHELAPEHARAWLEHAHAREQAVGGGYPWPNNLYFRALLLLRAGQEAEAAAVFRELERVEPSLYHQRIGRLFRLTIDAIEAERQGGAAEPAPAPPADEAKGSDGD